MSKKNSVELIDNSKNKNLFQCYTDKFGNVYYAYADPELIPKCRITYCERAARYAELYISETTFKKAVKEMKDAANKTDFTKVFEILANLEYSTHFLGEEESLFEIAAGVVMINDEDPYDLFPIDISNKIEIWKKDKMARDFFLRMAIPLTKSYSQKSPDDVLNYLNNPTYQMVKDKLNRYIS